MKYHQKKNGNRCDVFLKKDGLDYQFKDKNTEFSFSIEYEKIPFESLKITERNQWFRNAGSLWVIIGAYFLWSDFSKTGSIGFPFWLVLGAGCLIYYVIRQSTFTVFDTAKGRILILDDKNGKDITTLIEDRRAAQIREKYGEIDWNNNPDSEIRRFQWMEEKGILTQEEFQDIKGRIRLSIEKPPMDSFLN